MSLKGRNFPKGLENYTLNCYLNSLIQCLYYVREFRNFLLETEFEESKIICKSLKELMIELNRKDNNYFSIPKKLKNKIKKEKNIFSDGKGADVTDLLALIFDKIMDELEKEESSQCTVKYETKVDDKEIMFEDLYKEIDFQNIIINRLFVGFYEKEYKCSNGHIKYSFQNEYRIIFPLEKIYNNIKQKNYLTIYDCFDYYQKPKGNINNDNNNYSQNNNDEENETYTDNEDESENIDEIDKCYKCGKNCIMTEKIYRTPSILIIILDMGPKKKFDKKVEFYTHINLDNYIDDKKYEFPKEYQLIGVCTHLGSSGDFGHYISFCLCDDNNYYCFNDKNVKKIELNDNINSISNLFNGSPYILFYQRLDKKEKLIKKSIENFQYYIKDKIKNIHKIKTISHERKLKYIIQNDTIKNKFEFEIDFTNFSSSSENLEIEINSKETCLEDNYKNNKIEIDKYKWKENKTWKENEENVAEIIDHYLQKFDKYNPNKNMCYVF